MLGHPPFFLCLASSDRPRFSRFPKKKTYAQGNEGEISGTIRSTSCLQVMDVPNYRLKLEIQLLL